MTGSRAGRGAGSPCGAGRGPGRRWAGSPTSPCGSCR